MDVVAEPHGEVDIIGRLVEASNGTLLVRDQAQQLWVYKPVAGEAPLWDFPDGTLGRREVAAYRVSHELGLDVVPPTVWGEGPFGPGSFQAWIDGEIYDGVDVLAPEEVNSSWLPVMIAEDSDGNPLVVAHRDDVRLRRLALFDLVINNADRKAGHVIAHEDRLYGVDHGVTFHQAPKLRTVVWGFAHEPFTDEEMAVLSVASELCELSPGLAEPEWLALNARAAQLLANGEFPVPSSRGPAMPWPLW